MGVAKSVDSDAGNVVKACGEGIKRISELQQQGIWGTNLRESLRDAAHRRCVAQRPDRSAGAGGVAHGLKDAIELWMRGIIPPESIAAHGDRGEAGRGSAQALLQIHVSRDLVLVAEPAPGELTPLEHHGKPLLIQVHQANFRPGDLIWVFPGVGHAYGPEEGDQWEEIYLVFTGSMFDRWLETGLVNPKRPIWRADPVAAWHRRLNGVIPAQHPIGELAALAAAGRLQAVIADLAAQQATPSNAPSAAPSWLDAARSRLETGDSPEAVARSLKLGYDTFRKRFAAATGLAPARFQMLRRIEHACTLLRDDSLPLKTIAERTGFADEFHFSKRFRQIVGQPPGQFRDHGG